MTLKIKSVDFLKSCSSAQNYPPSIYPEFAFLGRSNVGKSSLINMIINRKDMVKTGSKPGVTKTINYFLCNDRMYFVDLPGYGYAKLPVELKKKFLPMIKSYVTSKRNIKIAFLLIDIRRIPSDFEHEIMSLLIMNKIPVAVILTKCDKLSKNQRIKQIKKIERELGIDRDSLFITSTLNGEGKKEILQIMGRSLKGSL